VTPSRHTSLRLFLTLWLIFCLHWATDFVREHFLVVSIVDQHTFALDDFTDLHPDIFVHSDGHSYHGANPGISMLGSVPYFVLSPVVDRVVARELAARQDGGGEAEYQDPRPARREFYRQVRERGWDIRFGLVGLITMVFAMAPLSAIGGVVFYKVTRGMGLTRGAALGGTMVYAFGTPVFLRSAYLNQNMAVGVVGFLAFALLWNPGSWSGLTERARWTAAGLAAGFALLCDYSGGLMLALVGGYGILKLRDDHDWPSTIRMSLWYAAGAMGPILLLWFYQWAAFGSPLYPPQHHMPPVEWSDLGYQGVATPQWDLTRMLLFDGRFGLFVTAPATVLALAAPFLGKWGRDHMPRREALVMLGIALAYVVFFSMVHYTRLQYITGIRYLVPILPFLMLPALVVLLTLPRLISYSVAFVSLVINWGLAMGRFQEQERSILDTLTRVYLEGVQLPALTTLSKMSASYLDGVGPRVSALAVMAMAAIVVVGIWRIETPWRPLAADRSDQPGGG
jgi:hypothetical protein